MSELEMNEAVDRLAEMMDAELATQESQQETAEDQAEIQAETPDDEPERMEAESAETDEEVDSEEAEEDSDDEPWTPETLDELAEAMEIDPDALKAIRVRTKIDGVEGEATLADLVKSYQIDKSLTHKSEQLAQQRKDFEAKAQASLQAFQQRIQTVDATIEALNKQVEEQVGRVDWDRLREEDPMEWSLKRQEMIERIGQIDMLKQQALKAQQDQFAEMQRQQAEEHQKRIQQEYNTLIEKIPEWRNEEARTAEFNEIKAFLKDTGFSDQDIQSVWRHEMIMLARDAMLHRKQVMNVQPKQKKLKKVPKFVKPSARKEAKSSRSTDYMNKLNKARKSQSDDDWAEALMAKLSN